MNDNNIGRVDTEVERREAVSDDLNETGGLHVPERTIPVPNTVSPEAQAFLRRGLADHAARDRPQGYGQVARVHDAGRNPDRSDFGDACAGVSVRDRRASARQCHAVRGDARFLVAGHEDKALLHIHGGAFIVGGGRSAAHTAQTYASLTGLRSFSIDYRMPPDHPYPAGLDDCIDAYRFMLERYEPSNIGCEGSSAGANLVAAMILRARDEGLPLPGACSLHTAGVDLTHSGDTLRDQRCDRHRAASRAARNDAALCRRARHGASLSVARLR